MLDLRWYALAGTGLAVVLTLSTWFSATAVADELGAELGLNVSELVWLTNAVQAGFVTGALFASFFALADVLPMKFLLALGALAAGLANAALLMNPGPMGAIAARFATGVSLALVYPTAMKFIGTWFVTGRGLAMGAVVGALTLGSAAPHLFRALGVGIEWRTVIAITTLACGLAVIIFILLREGPHQFKTTRFRVGQISRVLSNRAAMLVNLGYFGHMWELYTVWVLLPFILGTRLAGEPVLWWSFAIMGSGALGCVIGGHLVAKVGGVRVATTQLGVSGLCCLLAPLMLQAPDALFYAWLLVWGITVAGDSPQFSALTASRAPSHLVGSILTMTNSIGFAISIVSILLSTQLAQHWPLEVVLPLLAVGPALGVWAMR